MGIFESKKRCNNIYKHDILEIIIIIMEIFKSFNKQEITKSAFNSLFFFLAFYVTDCYPLITFLILLYEGFEIVSYVVCGTPTSLQVIDSIDFKWVFRYQSLMLILFLFLFVVFVSISYFRFGIVLRVTRVFENHFYVFSKYLLLTLIFVFFMNCYSGYNPLKFGIKNSSTEDIYISTALQNFYDAKINVQFKNPEKKKNLIIIEMESCEKDIMGRFNEKYKKSMPFLSNLSEQTTHVNFVGSSLYTGWSIAAMFASQCGLPLLLTGNNQGQFQLFKGHRCFGDYLDKLGYNLYSVETGHFVGNFANHLRLHHWSVEDITVHGHKHDMATFQYIVSNLFPRLEEPFVLHISNTDTHPFPKFYIDPKCKRRVPDYPFPLQSFDCFDQIFEEFFKGFQQSKYFNNTEMIAFSDHILMAYQESIGIKKKKDERSLNVIIPTRPKNLIQKKSSIYDLAPTYFDLLDIEYSPKFLFGESLLSDKEGIGINKTTVQSIFEFFNNRYYYMGKLY